MANRKKKNSNTMSRGKRELKESYYFEINKKIFYKKNQFKGKVGIFEINKNRINHILNFYKVEDNEFKKIF